MSWYFLGGFSAYAIVPSARWVNHSGCSVTHGWSGEVCSARSIATSRPSSAARRTNASKSASVPRPGWMASWPPSGDPIAQGEPGSPGPRSASCWGPSGPWSRSGGPAGGRRRRSPSAAIASSRRAAVRSVPDFGARPGRRLDDGSLRPGKELVPGAVERALPVHEHRVPGRPGEQVPQRERVQDRGDVVGVGRGQAVQGRDRRIPQQLGQVRQDDPRSRGLLPFGGPGRARRAEPAPRPARTAARRRPASARRPGRAAP